MKLSGKSLRDAEAELVADRSPGRADGEVADVMGHEAGAGAEDGEIAAPLLHQLELVRFDRLAKLVVADLEFGDLGRLGGILDAGDLPVAPRLERLGGGGVVAVAVDDHGHASCRAYGSANRRRGHAGSMPWRRFDILRVSRGQIGHESVCGLGLGAHRRYPGREYRYRLNLRRQRTGDFNAGLADQFAQLLNAEVGVAVRDQCRHRDARRGLERARQKNRPGPISRTRP